MLLSEVTNTIFRNYCIKKIHTVPFESFSNSIMILFHLDLHNEMINFKLLNNKSTFILEISTRTLCSFFKAYVCLFTGPGILS